MKPPQDQIDEDTALLKAQAYAALRNARQKAHRHVKKTRMAFEAVEAEENKSVEDSKILRTLRFDKNRINGALLICGVDGDPCNVASWEEQGKSCDCKSCQEALSEWKKARG